MPKPIVRRVPISLKTVNGSGVGQKSSFWMNTTGVDTAGVNSNTVLIVQKDGSDGYWSGSIKPDTGSNPNPKKQKATVTYDPGPPPGGVSISGRKKKRVLGAGDVVDVTITVTNNTTVPQSGSSDGEVIADLD